MFDIFTMSGIVIAAVVGAVVWRAYRKCKQC